MLDMRRIRENPEELKEAAKKRNFKGFDIDDFLSLDSKRRALISEADEMKALRNEVSAKIPQLMREGEDTREHVARMKEVSQNIKALDADIAELDKSIREKLLSLPNIPHESVPVGADDTANVEIRRKGEPREFDFEPKPHWEIGEKLGIIDAATAAKVTGARFTFYKGMGARLERAIVNFFLDTHSSLSGYTEVLPPFIANKSSMTGTGQLPKFQEDMFKLEGLEYYLIPTAEVPVTNMFKDEILELDALPISYCAYSACFRAEAGSAGRDTRGLIRQHQFNKVELVKFTAPENSYDELESLTKDAELVLKKLGIPYRVVSLSTGDLGFGSAKTYDIEVWMPSYGRYVEISSCSNYEDFQARRAQIRFRREKSAKPELVHTLNGSGVAVGRTTAAILENFQLDDGRVRIPDVLVPYMGVKYLEEDK